MTTKINSILLFSLIMISTFIAILYITSFELIADQAKLIEENSTRMENCTELNRSNSYRVKYLQNIFNQLSVETGEAFKK